MVRIIFVFLISLLFRSFIYSQDTIRVMSYNILNYSSTDANKTRYKDLKVIVNYFLPDVFIISELQDAAGAQLLLDSAFNSGNPGAFSRAVFNNGPDTDNMIFFRNQKIKLKSQAQISTSLRDISHYKIYHINAPADTSWINIFSAHLKAGNTSSDQNDRLSEVTSFCNYLTSFSNNDNIILGGDFNMYASTEPAWQYLTLGSCSPTLYDPINMPGAWNNNSAFSSIHTQSTRTSSNPGCCGGSTGGLDDRFDVFLTSSRVLNGGSKIKYLPGSYIACGNDGNHLNAAITDAPVNTVVPISVSTALFNMSDHLPIKMDLTSGSSVGLPENKIKSEFFVRSLILNNGENSLCVQAKQNSDLKFSIYSLEGKKLKERKLNPDKEVTFIPTKEFGLDPGAYIFVVNSSDGKIVSCMFIER